MEFVPYWILLLINRGSNPPPQQQQQQRGQVMQDKIILITFKSGAVQYIPLNTCHSKHLVEVLKYISVNFDCIEEYIIVEQATT